MRVDRQASITPASLLGCLHDATVTNGVTSAVRTSPVQGRSVPIGGLLGPLDATHFAVGDVASPTNSHLIEGGNGRRRGSLSPVVQCGVG
jgi:hypothetical protein